MYKKFQHLLQNKDINIKISSFLNNCDKSNLKLVNKKLYKQFKNYNCLCQKKRNSTYSHGLYFIKACQTNCLKLVKRNILKSSYGAINLGLRYAKKNNNKEIIKEINFYIC